MAKEISNKNFGIKLEDDGTLSYHLGNWTDAGWYWDGDSADHSVLLFLYRIAHSSIQKDFEAGLAKNPEIRAALDALVVAESKNAEALEMLAYGMTGDNRFWHFGGFGEAVDNAIDNEFYEMKTQGGPNGEKIVTDDIDVVIDYIQEEYNDLFVDAAAEKEKEIIKAAADALAKETLTVDSILSQEHEEDIQEEVWEQISEFGWELFDEARGKAMALPDDDPRKLVLMEPLRERPTGEEEIQTNIFDAGAEKKGAAGSKGRTAAAGPYTILEQMKQQLGGTEPAESLEKAVDNYAHAAFYSYAFETLSWAAVMEERKSKNSALYRIDQSLTEAAKAREFGKEDKSQKYAAFVEVVRANIDAAMKEIERYKGMNMEAARPIMLKESEGQGSGEKVTEGMRRVKESVRGRVLAAKKENPDEEGKKNPYEKPRMVRVSIGVGGVKTAMAAKYARADINFALYTVNPEGGKRDTYKEVVDALNKRFNTMKEKNPKGFLDEFESRFGVIMEEVAREVGVKSWAFDEAGNYLFCFAPGIDAQKALEQQVKKERGASKINGNRERAMGKTGEVVQKIAAGAAKPIVETKADKVRRLRAEAERRAKGRTSEKGAKAAPETDENGTPVVGGAPEGDGGAAGGKPAAAPGAPAAAPAKPAVSPDNGKGAEPPAPEPVAQGEKEDAATVLVRVNEKIQEIEERTKVDDAVKKELVDIRNTLTGVTASIRKRARADRLTDEQLHAVVAFLEKADRVYETAMKGFEAKAGMGAAMASEAARIRTAVDAGLQKAHEDLLAYKEGKAGIRVVEASVGRLRSGIEQWNTLQRAVTAFRSESKTVQGSRGHLREVIAVMAGLLDNGQISSGDELSQKTLEYFDMAPDTFKGVRAFLSKEGTIHPQSVPAVQSMGSGSDIKDLESIFS